MTGVSSLGQALGQISRLKAQQTLMGDLSTQVATGKKTQTMSGLGSEAIKSLRSRSGVNSLDVYITNIKNADRRLKLMQNSIDEIKAQAENISASLMDTTQEGDYPDLEGIQKMAENIYNFIIDNLNETDGDRYLFGGGDTSERPITDTGFMASFLGTFTPDETNITNPPLDSSGIIGAWGSGSLTTDDFIDAYHNISDTIMGYSDALTSDTAGKTAVRVDDNSEFDYTVLANEDAFREIITVLGVLKSLPPVKSAPGALNDPTATTLAQDTLPYPPAEKQENFYAVLNDLSASLNAALDKLDQTSFHLAQTQSQISIVKESHTNQIDMYKDIIGSVEDVDITEASVKITALQTQIETSYAVTAIVSQLSLTSFLN